MHLCGMKGMKIVFMGTPAFAVASLQAILEKGFEVVGVVTVPDKPAGRGQKLMTSAVKDFALSHHLPVLQPVKLKDPDFLQQLANLNADLFVVVAFRMLPKEVWQMPPKGTINLHGSLLPKYRGAAPIHWAIINGEKETGVTTFFINEEIDMGNIIEQRSFPIAPQATLGEIHDEMMVIGGEALCSTLSLIAEGKAQALPQSHWIEKGVTPSAAPKLSKEIATINWQQSSKTIHDFVRGMSPFPCAWTSLEDKQLKVYFGEIATDDSEGKVGDWKTDGKTVLSFKTTDGWYNILSLQFEGKKKMEVSEFLRGWRPQSPRN
jgi:methionyl-tRNA formyltransferase